MFLLTEDSKIIFRLRKRETITITFPISNLHRKYIFLMAKFRKKNKKKRFLENDLRAYLTKQPEGCIQSREVSDGHLTTGNTTQLNGFFPPFLELFQNTSCEAYQSFLHFPTNTHTLCRHLRVLDLPASSAAFFVLFEEVRHLAEFTFSHASHSFRL